MIKHTLIGAGIGTGAGLVLSKKGDKTKGALIGAGIGGAAGAGVKAGRNKYKQWLLKGAPKKVTYDAAKYQNGDIMIVHRGNGMDHYGIYVGDGKIIEYGSKKRDPRKAHLRTVSLQEFGSGDTIRTEAPKGFTRDEVVQRAQDRLRDGQNGKYHLINNNCEHFARDVANGTRVSTQVTDILSKIGLKPKTYSAVQKEAVDLLSDQGKHLISKNLFKIRKHLSKDLGGLRHIDKYQTAYLSGGGSVLGGAVGRYRGGKKAKKEAEEKYGLKKGTLEYDNYVRRGKDRGTIIGAGVGAGLGFGASKGMDYVRGKVVSDKARIKGQDLGHDYLNIGKGFRGLGEKEIDTIKGNWREVGDYVKAFKDAIL